ncbi:MAG TPA: hypothetical protein VK308_05340 [Pyrinomonadaceae bacterium]|jgi:hypothetical protein|nr:hypothetical protein [Pyrinomonadaceae bacterium]
MSDILGLLFFILLVVGSFVGLKILSKSHRRTEAEFERNAAESSSIGGAVNALQEAFDPAAARANEVQTQIKEGRYGKKKREGKANGEDEIE